MYKQKPLTDIERTSYFRGHYLPLVDVYPKGWLWNIVVFSIQLHPTQLLKSEFFLANKT